MDTFLGSLLLVPYNFAPQGWMACQGQLLQISQYSAVFALIGTTYGGDGQTTFALPNMTGANAPKDANGNPLMWVICMSGIFPSRG